MQPGCRPSSHCHWYPSHTLPRVSVTAISNLSSAASPEWAFKPVCSDRTHACALQTDHAYAYPADSVACHSISNASRAGPSQTVCIMHMPYRSTVTLRACQARGCLSRGSQQSTAWRWSSMTRDRKVWGTQGFTFDNPCVCPTLCGACFW
jgi:hypothetical protein